MKYAINCIFLIFICALYGCSTLESKLEYSPSHIGNEFSGLELNSEKWRCEASKYAPIFFIVWPFYIVDFAASVVGDVVFLPADLVVKSEANPEISRCGNPFS